MKITIPNWIAIIVGVALGVIGSFYLLVFIIANGMR